MGVASETLRDLVAKTTTAEIGKKKGVHLLDPGSSWSYGEDIDQDRLEIDSVSVPAILPATP
jgi:hypothetical protein